MRLRAEVGIDLRAQIFIACRPAGRITLAHCLELLASFRFHILRQNLRRSTTPTALSFNVNSRRLDNPLY